MVEPRQRRFASISFFKIFLVCTGLIAFFIGANILGLSLSPPPYKVHILQWPHRITDQTHPVRILGWQTKTGESIQLSGCEPTTTAQNPHIPAESTVLELTAPKGSLPNSICIEAKGWGRHFVSLNSQPAYPITSEHKHWNVASGDIHKSSKNEFFPFRVVAIPEHGTYNPRAPDPHLIIWIHRDGIDVETIPVDAVFIRDRDSNLQELKPTPLGLYRAPIKSEVLSGSTEILIESEGEKYAHTFNFTRQDANAFQINGHLDGRDLELLVHRYPLPGSPISTAKTLYCTLFIGQAAIGVRHIELPADGSPVEVRTSLSFAPNSPTAISCSETATGPDSSSVTSWLTASPDGPLPETTVRLIKDVSRSNLPEELALTMGAWAESETMVERARALTLFRRIVSPVEPDPIADTSTYDTEYQLRSTNLANRRRNLLMMMAGILVTWLAIVLVALHLQRETRLKTMRELGEADPTLLADIVDRAEANDPLGRPGSTKMAILSILVMILAIIGLLWVLGSF
ncbi:MAG: hypothetical protein CMH54_11920 [Myxococcales bacterium]|nr:hypothetical protein [Myxococcales bacterium]